MSKVDFNQELHDMDGGSMSEMDRDYKTGMMVKTGNIVTLKNVSCNSLKVLVQGEDQTFEIQKKKYDLTQKILKSNGPVDITSEEAVLIKERIAKIYRDTWITGQCGEMLEGNKPNLTLAE